MVVMGIALLLGTMYGTPEGDDRARAACGEVDKTLPAPTSGGNRMVAGCVL